MVAEDGHAATLDLAGKLGNVAGTLLRLTFVDATTYEPVLAQIGQALGTPMSILQGSVGRIKDRPYGQLIVGFSGDAELARRAFEERGVRCDVVTA
ncbi:NIL domain-containing protein [Chitinimonas sp. PSY-7]|uniref:NIL domain-containing protein n=1 Tax=Chitinimonas sp. PSY-7 TaxID=3459088 RepID=UPI00403FEA45